LSERWPAPPSRYLWPGNPEVPDARSPASAAVEAPGKAQTTAIDGATRNAGSSLAPVGAAAKATPRAARPDGTGAIPARADLQLSGARLDAERSGEVAAIDKLLSSPSAFCVFDPGAGGQWPQGKLFAHTAA
jgi:hypothetical protein